MKSSDAVEMDVVEILCQRHPVRRNMHRHLKLPSKHSKELTVLRMRRNKDQRMRQVDQDSTEVFHTAQSILFVFFLLTDNYNCDFRTHP